LQQPFGHVEGVQLAHVAPVQESPPSAQSMHLEPFAPQVE